VVEVDKGGAPRGGDTVLRAKGHSREQLARRWFGDALVRASGREARPRPARRKTGEAQRCGGGVQRWRGITRASVWTCVRAWVRACAGSETRRRAKAQRHTAPERKGKGLRQKARERVEEGSGTCKATGSARWPALKRWRVCAAVRGRRQGAVVCARGSKAGPQLRSKEGWPHHGGHWPTCMRR
jgi:hypothetical protein